MKPRQKTRGTKTDVLETEAGVRNYEEEDADRIRRAMDEPMDLWTYGQADESRWA